MAYPLSRWQFLPMALHDLMDTTTQIDHFPVQATLLGALGGCMERPCSLRGGSRRRASQESFAVEISFTPGDVAGVVGMPVKLQYQAGFPEASSRKDLM